MTDNQQELIEETESKYDDIEYLEEEDNEKAGEIVDRSREEITETGSQAGTSSKDGVRITTIDGKDSWQSSEEEEEVLYARRSSERISKYRDLMNF